MPRTLGWCAGISDILVDSGYELANMAQPEKQRHKDIDNERKEREAAMNEHDDMVKIWLISIEMDRYYDIFMQNGLVSLEVIKRIRKKSKLKDIGIRRLADQCLIMSEIRNLNFVYI